MSVLASAEPRLASGGSVPAISAGSYYKKVYSRKTLRDAWRVVYSNGISSDKEETRRLVKEFNIGVETHLDRIYRQLLKVNSASHRQKGFPYQGKARSLDRL